MKTDFSTIQNDTKEEMIPHYDLDGNVIGYVSRRDAEKNGLLHKVVHVWILTPDGDFILQRRSSKKPNGGRWTASASGHIDAYIDKEKNFYSAESNVQAALRETEEELGIKIKPEELKLIGKNFLESRDYPDSGKKIRKLTDVFLVCKDVDLSKLRLQEGEVSEVKKCNYLVFEGIINAIKKKRINSPMISEHFEIYDKLLQEVKAVKYCYLEDKEHEI